MVDFGCYRSQDGYSSKKINRSDIEKFSLLHTFKFDIDDRVTKRAYEL